MTYVMCALLSRSSDAIVALALLPDLVALRALAGAPGPLRGDLRGVVLEGAGDVRGEASALVPAALDVLLVAVALRAGHGLVRLAVPRALRVLLLLPELRSVRHNAKGDQD